MLPLNPGACSPWAVARWLVGKQGAKVHVSFEELSNGFQRGFWLDLVVNHGNSGSLPLVMLAFEGQGSCFGRTQVLEELPSGRE